MFSRCEVMGGSLFSAVSSFAEERQTRDQAEGSWDLITTILINKKDHSSEAINIILYEKTAFSKMFQTAFKYQFLCFFPHRVQQLAD